MIRPFRNAFIALLAVVVLAACQSPKASAGGMEVMPINTTCPISDEDVDSSSEIVTFEGQSVALCCKKCVRKWDGWDDAKKSAYVAKVTK